ncbi:MAG TPA: TQO small subunit DoxD [Gemmatimonadales bacterium]|nr:TQO small subunit DoxD [Gemmatimonadales bacterium]
MSLPGEIIQGILARGALVVLRVYLGVVFLLAALPAVQWDSPADSPGFLGVALEQGHPFYREFVHQVLVPSAAVLGEPLRWTELVVGMTLVLGLLTRLSAAVALLLALNYMFARGAWFWTPGSSDAAHVAIALAILIGAAGRTLGLDSLLARRWPRSPFW